MPKYVVGMFPVVHKRKLVLEAEDYKAAVKAAIKLANSAEMKLGDLGWRVELDFVYETKDSDA